MGIEEIKKEFILLMEEAHQGLLFPKNYFGCMMAIFIEQEPVTQDRIEELTGYSKTTISQIIKLIQMNIQLEKLKKPKIRKKFYSIETPPREFMLKFLRRIMDSYQNRADFVPPLIEEILPYVDKHIRFRNFYVFLKKLYASSALYINLIVETSKELEDLIYTGQIQGTSLLNNNLMSSPENLKYLQEIMKPPQPSNSIAENPILSEELSEIFFSIKNRFYQQLSANLTLNESQFMSARRMIATELLLENRPLTQEDIEKSTHFARSLISDVLALLLNWKMIQVIKKPHDRKNYYLMNQSWDVRMINRLRINKKYADDLSQKIISLIEKANEELQSDKRDALVDILEQIRHSFFQYGQYFKFLELKYLNDRVQKHLDEEKSQNEHKA
ncbi:hypothetical protein NEF87_000644 [Candidatus Lokiarchaeum ossiferum]|uniref:MarR family transcriptional regulator n=1 Tax=Candidatus Lokiarchaeum ossiferum TaxID=2951803 RepID=A0ABY6HP76_9ARCH|nr:hypothetical protein NEF87_000644 [Candidatus Lokiarchaeum sp. B-35]